MTVTIRKVMDQLKIVDITFPEYGHWKTDLTKYRIDFGNGITAYTGSEKEARKIVTAGNLFYRRLFTEINLSAGQLYQAWKSQVPRSWSLNKKISGLFVDFEYTMQKIQKKYSSARFQAVQFNDCLVFVASIASLMQENYPMLEVLWRSVLDKTLSDKAALDSLGQRFNTEFTYSDFGKLPDIKF